MSSLPVIVVILVASVLMLAYFRTPRYAKGGEVPPHQEREGVPVLLSHGWQEFQPFCVCPRCGKHDLHTLDVPSDYEPKVVDQETIQTWGGQAFTVTRNEFDRVDERGWAVARVCRCGKRWGQR